MSEQDKTQSGSDVRSIDEVRSLLERSLAGIEADEGQARYHRLSGTATRFGENAITQNIGGASEELVVEVWVEGRPGSATTNMLDEEGLREVAAKASAIARQSPVDPEHVALPGPQTYGERPQRYFPETAGLSPVAIADDVARIVAGAKAAGAGYRASGLFDVSSKAGAMANTRGLFVHDAETRVDYSTTIHGPAGSGKGAANESCRSRIDVDAIAEEAVENARRAQNPVAIEPGDYDVIFEPLAVSGLVGFMGWVMNARDADEGTSVFSGTTGTQLLSEKINLRLATDDPVLPAQVYGDAGLPVRATTWVAQGVIKRLYHNRYWGQQQGTPADAAREPLIIDGEDRSVADLVAGCERGLLVKNLWYIRFVDTRTLTLTGMTRDGVFLVEKGKIVRPVKNMRWNESPITFLQNVVGMSRAQRVGSWVDMRVPAIHSRAFTFTSVTDSI
jgi:predicted Zn-dependent protease